MPATPGFTSAPVSVGADVDNVNATVHFTGTLDDIRLYARALTPEEIAELAQPQ